MRIRVLPDIFSNVLIKGFRLTSKGVVLLVGVSFCIKAIAQRHLGCIGLIQSVSVLFWVLPMEWAFFAVPAGI